MSLFMVFILLASTFLGSAQVMMPINDGCSHSSSTMDCTLTYKVAGPAQSGPVSTVYAAIMTTYYNIIDCHYCTVVNVQENPPAQGPFYARTTSSLLVVTGVGCMPGTTAITRRDFRGYDETTAPTPAIEARTTLTTSPDNRILPRVISPKRKHYRRDHVLAGRQSSAQNTTSTPRLSGTAGNLWTSVNTAIYAIQLLSTPNVNAASLCRELRVTQQVPSANSDEPGVDFEQCANIVCWAAVWGFDFNATNFEVIFQLYAAIEVIQFGPGYPGFSNSSDPCSEIDFNLEPYLGINASAVSSYICPSATPTSNVTTTQPPITTAASVGTGLWSLTAPTGGAGPYQNSTSLTGTGTSGADPYTNSSGFTGVSTGGAGPYTNGSGSTASATRGGYDSFNITFPTTAAGGYGQPKNPSTRQYYPAVETSSRASLAWRAY